MIYFSIFLFNFGITISRSPYRDGRVQIIVRRPAFRWKGWHERNYYLP